MSFAVQNLGWPAELIGAVPGKEILDGGATLWRSQVAMRRLGTLPVDRQCVGPLIELGSKCGEALVAHQHQEPLLREIGGRGRVEAGGTILDGIEAVGGDGLAGR